MNAAKRRSVHWFYHRQPLRWWMEQELVTVEDITTNGGTTIPAGARVRVVGKFHGLTIETELCPCCRLRARAARVESARLRFCEGYPVEAGR